jgi:hypothetical protein
LIFEPPGHSYATRKFRMKLSVEDNLGVWEW